MKRKRSPNMVCHDCGCTNLTPCIGSNYLPCHWVSPGLCSACAEPKVAVFSEAEANSIIKELSKRASAGGGQ